MRFVVFRVRPIPSRFPDNIFYTPLGNKCTTLVMSLKRTSFCLHYLIHGTTELKASATKVRKASNLTFFFVRWRKVNNSSELAQECPVRATSIRHVVNSTRDTGSTGP